MDRIVDYLSSYTNALAYEDLPEDVIHQSKRLWLDTLGCALGAFSSGPSKIARDAARRVSSTRPATILWSGDPTSPDLAAFANGIMIRYLDFNDFYQGPEAKESGHPTDGFAAVLPAAEINGRDGKAAILGAVLAWEVYARFADAAALRDLGFDQAINIGIAASCGASKMMNLTPEQTAHAIALTAASNVVLGEIRFGNVSMWKGCAAANACRNAVFSTELAADGMTGPLDIFEGSRGMVKAVTGPFELPEFGGNGNPFRIMQSSFKHYPAGSVAQTALECAMKIRPRLDSIEDIVEVNIQTFAFGANVMADGPDKWDPENRETADHSMPYVMAVALMYGEVDGRYFSDRYIQDPQLRALVHKIRVEASDECTRVFPEQRLSIVEIVTRDGTRHSERLGYHRGHPENPISDLEIEDKFRSLADGLLTEPQTEEIIQRVWHLDDEKSLDSLLQLMRI